MKRKKFPKRYFAFPATCIILFTWAQPGYAGQAHKGRRPYLHKNKQNKLEIMKRNLQSLLGISAYRSEPESVEEFQKLSNGEVLAYANDEAYYRNIAPKVRSRFLDAVVALTGIAFKTKNVTVGEGEAAKEVEAIDEKDTAYIKRVIASGTSKDELTPVLQKAFDDVGWDLSSTRNTGPTKKDAENAAFYIDAVEQGKTTWDRLVANFEYANPGLVISREDDGTCTLEVWSDVMKVHRVNQAEKKLL